MLSILRKTTASSSKSSGSTSPGHNDDVVVDELSTWEFVNSSLTDDEEDLYSFDGDDVISEESEPKAEEEVETRGACESSDPGTADDVMCLRSLSVSPPLTFPVEAPRHHSRNDDGDEEEEKEVDEEEDDVYDDDVDDYLVPWELKGRFGKQRITKMGKRLGPKPNRSNKLPCYYHNRPKKLYEKGMIAVQPAHA